MTRRTLNGQAWPRVVFFLGAVAGGVVLVLFGHQIEGAALLGVAGGTATSLPDWTVRRRRATKRRRK